MKRSLFCSIKLFSSVLSLNFKDFTMKYIIKIQIEFETCLIFCFLISDICKKAGNLKIFLTWNITINYQLPLPKGAKDVQVYQDVLSVSEDENHIEVMFVIIKYFVKKVDTLFSSSIFNELLYLNFFQIMVSYLAFDYYNG